MGGAFRKDRKRLFALSASMVFDRHRLVTDSGDLALLKFPGHSRFHENLARIPSLFPQVPRLRLPPQ